MIGAQAAKADAAERPDFAELAPALTGPNAWERAEVLRIAHDPEVPAATVVERARVYLAFVTGENEGAS